MVIKRIAFCIFRLHDFVHYVLSLFVLLQSSHQGCVLMSSVLHSVPLPFIPQCMIICCILRWELWRCVLLCCNFFCSAFRVYIFFCILTVICHVPMKWIHRTDVLSHCLISRLFVYFIQSQRRICMYVLLHLSVGNICLLGLLPSSISPPTVLLAPMLGCSSK